MGTPSERLRRKRVDEALRKAAVRPRSRRGPFMRAVAVLDEFIEHHPISRIFTIAFGFVAGGVVIATGMQVYTDIQARKEERIARAWETLIRSVGGNTGKGAAFSYLASTTGTIVGIDLSCKSMGSCGNPPIISNIDLPESVSISGINISGSHITDSSLRGARIINLHAEDARIYSTDLSGVNITGELDGLAVDNSDFSNAYMYNFPSIEVPRASKPTITINQSDVSNLTAHDVRLKSLSHPLAGSNYAWADRPPKYFSYITAGDNSLQDFLHHVKFCDPRDRRSDLGGSMNENAIFKRIQESPRGAPANLSDMCRLEFYEARRAFPESWN